MTAPTKSDVLKALATIKLGSGKLTADDIASNVQVTKEGEILKLLVVLDVPDGLPKSELDALQAVAESSLHGLNSDAQIAVILSAHKAAPTSQGKSSCGTKTKTAPPQATKPKGVKKVIAVASGKGGVGKSLVAVNLALSLAYHHGLKVGILDADIQGPSVPYLLGLKGSLEQNEKGVVIPHKKHGVAAMSIGFMIEEGQAAIWRGPMMHKMLGHISHDVEWGELDVLIVDTPPGTGDVQLSLKNHLELDGVVIVSTPQELALADARRGIELFHKMHVPILGMVENMCDQENGPKLFGRGGAKSEAKKQNVDFLGNIPLDPAYAEASEAGAPVIATDPHSAQSGCFKTISTQLLPILVV